MPLKVLIVDDASFVRDTVKRTLRQFISRIEIHEAVDGRRAVAQMKVNKIDLILSDWEMPEMTGQEFLQWVREESDYPKVPFVMVSSRGDREHVVEAIKMGVNDYLSKPFTPEELMQKVSKQLKRIGYKDAAMPAASESGSGFGSLEVLTGAKEKAVQVGTKPANISESALFSPPAKSNRPAAATKKKPGGNFEGKAQLRFPKVTCQCVVRDLSLQALSGFMMRPEIMPTLFDQAVVDLEDKEGKALARVNAYVSSIQAMENNPNTTKLKITVTFVDNDPDKFEAISKAIT